jgi:hypothetical protein
LSEGLAGLVVASCAFAVALACYVWLYLMFRRYR